MRLLITGASGLLGMHVALEALREHEVTAVDRGRLTSAPFAIVRADLTQRGAVESTLKQAKPDALIHCAALADLELCEQDPALAQTLNTDLPGELAAACAEKDVRFVHISTDAVFDGTKDGPYTEDDEPNPRSTYARTKLDGERAVQRANPDAIVARVNFYGWSLSGRRSLAEFFVNSLRQEKEIKGFTDVFFCPMLVNHTALLLLEMLHRGLNGLYHLVGPESMSKYEFGVRIARTFGLREELISPESVRSSNLTATRSHNLRLSVHKLSTDLGHDFPGFSPGLAEFYAQFQQGYPQKIRSYQQELPSRA